MTKEELQNEIANNWLTTNQLLQYIKKRYNKTWSRQNLHILQKKHNFEGFKIGYFPLYSKVGVDQIMESFKDRRKRGEDNERAKDQAC